MRTIIGSIALGCLLMANVGFARALDTSKKALAVQNKISGSVMRMPGVNSIGVGACLPKTGEIAPVGTDFVHCVVIGTETDEARLDVLEVYPEGTKIQGVYIAVQVFGDPEPQPRSSAGN